MANEASFTIDMALKSGTTIDHTWSPGTIQVNLTDPLYEQKVISVGTTDETLAVDTITTISHVALWNLDDTNYVQYGDNASTYLGRINAAGPPAFIPMDSGATLHLKANTGACNVLVIAYGT